MNSITCDLPPIECNYCGLEFTPGEINLGTNKAFPEWTTECLRCGSRIYITEETVKKIVNKST